MGSIGKVVAVVAILVRVALAQDAPLDPPTEDSPWSRGVSEADQKLAELYFAQGITEFEHDRFLQALDLYKQALAHWDHPAIHYNMAVSYNRIGDPVEALKSLDRAMAHGEAALGHDRYAQGLDYRTNFEALTARIHIVCTEPSAKVSLDGRPVLVGPGELDDVVLPGEHQVVAGKPGFLTTSEAVVLEPGTTTRHEVQLVASEAPPRMARPWPLWKPWVVGGAGLAAASLGGILYVFATDNFAAYDQGIQTKCPKGCNPADAAKLTDLNRVQARGYAEQAASGWLFGLGTAAVVAGIVGVLLDEPRASLGHLAAIPVAGGASLTFGGRF
jgi:hypothetical protein